MSQRSLQEATTSNRSWLVVFTLYWETQDGQQYQDSYSYHFQSCTLTDAKSIEKFEALRDHILATEKPKGNQSHWIEWGWKATPWENRRIWTEDDNEIIVARFLKE